MNDNPLKTISGSIAQLKALTTLDLSWSLLQSLPESFGQLKALRWLDLRGAKINKSTIEKLKTQLAKCVIQQD